MARSHSVTPLEAPDVRAAVEAVRARGMRVSAVRRLVLEALYRTEEPMTAEQVADGVQGVPRSDIASVYRNLETLEAIGLVRHFHLGHGPGLYVRAGARAREYLACDSCSKVEALEPRELDEVRALIERVAGWDARFDHFPISGLCPSCRPPRGPRAMSERVR